MVETRVSVIVPTYNRKPYLLKTVSSFENQDYGNFEVVVVDDGSEEKAGEDLDGLDFSFSVRYFHIRNRGRAGARNAGIERSDGEILLFFDDHSQPHPALIREHADAHIKRKKFGGMRGRVVYIRDYGDVAIGDVPVGDVNIGGGPVPDGEPFFDALRKRLSQNSPIVNFGTHNLSVKRSVLLKTGGFDEEFDLYGAEDQEFGIRIRKAGYRLGYLPGAIAFNIRLDRSESDLLARALESGKMAALLLKKHPEYGAVLGLNVFKRITCGSRRHRRFYDDYTGGRLDPVCVPATRKNRFILYYYSLIDGLSGR